MIEVKNLKKQFGELSVLNGITEHISQGEKIAVIIILPQALKNILPALEKAHFSAV